MTADRDQGGRFVPGHPHLPRSPRPARPATPCARCGYPLAGRADQRACSPACRQAMYRRRVTATAHESAPLTPVLAADTAGDPDAAPWAVHAAVGALR